MPSKRKSEYEVQCVISEIADFLSSIDLQPKDSFSYQLLKSNWPSLKPYLIDQSELKKSHINAYNKLIKSAESSYVDFQILKSFVTDWLEINPSKMPDNLKQWLKGYLNDQIVIPKKSRGKVIDYQRRMWITVAAFKVIDKGFAAGKNESNSSNDNAFSIVAAAASQAGWQSVTYYTVRDYFEKMQHLAK